MNWRLARVIGLWGLILGDVSMLTLMAIGKAWYWFITFSGITLIIVAAEIASFIIKKKSISTQYGEWIKKQPVLALTALGLFIFAMLSLAWHLVGYSF